MAEYVNATDMAIATGKTKQWICKLCRDGRIPAKREGREWMIEAMTPLPLDPRGEKRIDRQKRRERLAKQRKMMDLRAELAPAKTWRDCTREEWEEDYTSSEIRVLEAILKNWHIAGDGKAWVRAKDNEPGQMIEGLKVRAVSSFDGWEENEDLQTFFRKHGGIISIEALRNVEDTPINEAPAMRPSKRDSDLQIQMKIDAWVDRGAEIDAQGNVTLNGEPKGRIVPWGAFERNWYEVSKNSV